MWFMSMAASANDVANRKSLLVDTDLLPEMPRCVTHTKGCDPGRTVQFPRLTVHTAAYLVSLGSRTATLAGEITYIRIRG